MEHMVATFLWGEHWQSGPRTVLGTWWQELPSEATRCFQFVRGGWIFEIGRTDKNRCLESRWQWVVDLKKTFRYIRNAYEMDQLALWDVIWDYCSAPTCDNWSWIMNLVLIRLIFCEDGARDMEHLWLPGNSRTIYSSRSLWQQYVFRSYGQVWRYEGMICWQLLRQLQFQKSRKLQSPHQLKVRLFVTSKFQYMPEMEVLYIMSPYIDRLFRGCEFSVLGKWNLWQSPACNKVSSTLPVLDFSSGFQPQIPRSVFS